jgi:hypothetical protein
MTMCLSVFRQPSAEAPAADERHQQRRRDHDRLQRVERIGSWVRPAGNLLIPMIAKSF